MSPFFTVFYIGAPYDVFPKGFKFSDFLNLLANRAPPFVGSLEWFSSDPGNLLKLASSVKCSWRNNNFRYLISTGCFFLTGPPIKVLSVRLHSKSYQKSSKCQNLLTGWHLELLGGDQLKKHPLALSGFLALPKFISLILRQMSADLQRLTSHLGVAKVHSNPPIIWFCRISDWIFQVAMLGHATGGRVAMYTALTRFLKKKITQRLTT